MNYIVMECHPAFAVLMDEKGRFVKAANRRYEVGQTVTDPVLEAAPRRRFVPSLKPIGRAVLAMAACLLVIFGIARFASSPSPYASVVVSINPSVRIDMDKNGTVTRTVGLNEDGKALLEGYSFETAELVAVTEDLLERATVMGYLKENGTVRFEVTCRDGAQKSRYEQMLTSHADVIAADRHVTVEVKGVDTTPVIPTDGVTYTATSPTTTATDPAETGSSAVTTTSTASSLVTTTTRVTTTTVQTITTTVQTTTTTVQTTTTTKGMLTEDEALAVVLSDIGVTLSDVQEKSVERDVENGKNVYEVELTVNGVEYEYCVDAVSGEILTLESDADTDDDDDTDDHD